MSEENNEDTTHVNSYSGIADDLFAGRKLETILDEAPIEMARSQLGDTLHLENSVITVTYDLFKNKATLAFTGNPYLQIGGYTNKSGKLQCKDLALMGNFQFSDEKIQRLPIIVNSDPYDFHFISGKREWVERASVLLETARAKYDFQMLYDPTQDTRERKGIEKPSAQADLYEPLPKIRTTALGMAGVIVGGLGFIDTLYSLIGSPEDGLTQIQRVYENVSYGQSLGISFGITTFGAIALVAAQKLYKKECKIAANSKD